jgi:hypothetical protein
MRPNETGPPKPPRDASPPGAKSSGILDPLEAIRQEVEQRMLRGDRFTDVEDRINSSDFSADEKAALWLLGWSYVHPRAQRREANEHLAALTDARPARAMSSRRRLRIVR